MRTARIESKSALSRLHDILDLLPSLNDNKPYDHLIVEAPAMMQLSEYDIYNLCDLIEVLKIKQLTMIRVNFDHFDYRWVDCENLEKLSFKDCRYTSGFMIQLLTCAYDVESASDVSDCNITPDDLSNLFVVERVQKLCTYIQRNRRLMVFSCSEFDLTLLESNSAKHPRFHAAMRQLDGYIDRNVHAAKKCRQAIYQLFLIKYYSKENVFKSLSRDTLMIIAKLLHATMFTAAWDR